jgi:hypothetical protein
MNYQLPSDIQQRVDYLLQTDNDQEANELRDAYIYLGSVVDVDTEDDDYHIIDSLDHPSYLDQYDANDSMGLLH